MKIPTPDDFRKAEALRKLEREKIYDKKLVDIIKNINNGNLDMWFRISSEGMKYLRQKLSAAGWSIKRDTILDYIFLKPKRKWPFRS